MESDGNPLGVYLLAFLTVSALSVVIICFDSNTTNKLIFADAQEFTSNVTTDYSNIPSAESVHTIETMKLPPNIDTFVMLIANEAHESWRKNSIN